ncbi:MAG: CHASE2 domain-containing protein [Xenococcaceae cyanobacterium MO_207.B15]|nr:CHASE2 domain-containing protein [Xenococcaceae cyanobacterium MO_207.B15]
MNQLKLTIKKISYICDFNLSWSKNKTLVAQLQYPESLSNLYQKWRNAYFNYYQSLRVTAKKIIINQSPKDYHRVLRDSHYQLIDEFQCWLLSPELVTIRRQIVSIINNNPQENLDLLIACYPNELTRLPWETWDIGSDLAAKNQVRIARTTINSSSGIKTVSRSCKPRILAIIGYDPNLDFSQDIQTIKSLSKLADIDFIGNKLVKNDSDLREQVFDKITSVDGWDILFFIGHSNEANWGGEFYLAPNLSLKIEDMQESLSQAAKNGLKLAFFNSCSGIDLAESLIQLGLSQVIVMREAVNNTVASQIIEKFVTSLSEYKNVQEALIDYYSFFKQENIQQKYPSAYLIPSLYRHPNSKLFRFQTWQENITNWLPEKQTLKYLLLLLCLSLLPPVQDLLLEVRLVTQLLYRQVTRQIDQTKQPPTVLIKIDEESLTKANLPWRTREEIDRTYLAQLINSLHKIDTNPKIIGIDYKLWEPKPEEDNVLKQAIQAGAKQDTQFVFAASRRDKKTIIPEIADPKTSLQGDIYFYPGYLELLEQADCQDSCPFAYLLALVNSQQQPDSSNLSQTTAFLEKLRLNPISSFSQNFAQMWFHPILDLSIPPEQIYSAIPAWCLLENDINSVCQALDNLQQQIVIIAAGGYEEADDNFVLPLAIQFAQKQPSQYFTGGQAHAYMVHHFLNRQIVTPIPDVMVMLLTAIISQAIIVNIRGSQRQKWILILLAANIAYVFISLQLYVSLKLLVPLFFPSVLLWTYISISIGSKYE